MIIRKGDKINFIVNIGHKMLSNSLCYDSFQKIVGATNYRKISVANMLSVSRGKDVVDLGCGTGKTIPLLDASQKYLGLDLSQPYLSKASKIKTKSEIELKNFDLGNAGWGKHISSYDRPLILAMGVFHHLDNLTLNFTFEELGKNINPGTVIYSIDPIVSIDTSRMAAWFVNNDRGRWIRNSEQLKKLFMDHGWILEFNLAKRKLRIPYDTIECIGRYVG
jgi:cyclopropane fatty-acyl-phospholipid synthase-like methyltransferase